MSKARELSQLGDKIDIDDTTGDFAVDTDTLYVDVSADNVGIGTSSPDSSGLHIRKDTSATTNNLLQLSNGAGSTTDGVKLVMEVANTSGNGAEIGTVRDGGSFNPYMYFSTSAGVGSAPTERMRIDSSGNLLVSRTSTSDTVVGGMIRADGFVQSTRDGGIAADFNRKSSDGDIVRFSKNSSSVGTIGSVGGDLFVGTGDTNLVFHNDIDSIFPAGTSGATRDNAIDMGQASNRFDDIFATNGTIQTSDENEKQQIAALTDAEMTAAKAISKLFKTFKWNDKVEAKGDAARTHTGVIAQQVETAMSDAGLDAGNYAFFISTTWWEADGDTYYTLEEAPEGATERNRKGIRYPELLSFIGAATEQRLTSIEARLDALEA
jgi:hypothetical protein